PSSRLITRASVPRNCSLSSTIETVMLIDWLVVVQGYSQTYHRTCLRCPADRKTAADVLHSFAHVAQPVPGLRLCVLQPGNTPAVVLNLQDECGGFQAKADRHSR